MANTNPLLSDNTLSGSHPFKKISLSGTEGVKAETILTRPSANIIKPGKKRSIRLSFLEIKLTTPASKGNQNSKSRYNKVIEAATTTE